MKKRIDGLIKLLATWQKQNLFVSPFHILLLITVVGLFIAAFVASLTSNEGSTSVTKLKVYLKALLESDLMTLRSQDEVVKLEKLINHVKITCEDQNICGDHELWMLLEGVSKKVGFVLQQVDLPGKSNWRLFNAIAQEFCSSYAPGRSTLS